VLVKLFLSERLPSGGHTPHGCVEESAHWSKLTNTCRMNSGDDRLTDMSTEITGKPPYRPSLLRNWISLTGLVVVIGSLFSFFMLLMLDAVAHFSNLTSAS